MADNKSVKRYASVPEALWGKFPNAWILMLQKNTRILLETNLIILSFLVLYATLLGPPHVSNWVYLLTASLGPFGVAIWYYIFPLNPYRTMSAAREGMSDMDRDDKVARDFVTLLKSSEANRFLFRTATKLSSAFFFPMIIISIILRAKPIWRLGLDSAVRIPAFLFICLFILFRMELLAWAIRSWKEYPRATRTVH